MNHKQLAILSVLGLGVISILCVGCLFLLLFLPTPSPEEQEVAVQATFSPSPFLKSATPPLPLPPSPIRTATVILSSTRTPTSAVRTKPSAATLDSYKFVDPRELSKAPSRFKEQKLTVVGTAFNVQEEDGLTEFQVRAVYSLGASDYVTVYVRFGGVVPSLLDDNIAMVYGQGAGTITGTNLMGAHIEQPLIEADHVDNLTEIPTRIPTRRLK